MEISLFTKCLFEFIGTLVLVLLGDGVVAISFSLPIFYKNH